MAIKIMKGVSLSGLNTRQATALQMVNIKLGMGSIGIHGIRKNGKDVT